MLKKNYIILIIALILSPMTTFANWEGDFTNSGLDGEVYAMTEYDGKLYVGGDFTIADDIPAHCLVSWDGITWTPIVNNMTAPEPYWIVVRALYVYDNKLYVGGNFTGIDGLSVEGVACWDGETWSVLGPGITGGVYSFTEYNGKLILGGSFTVNGGMSSENVAAWDGSTFTGLGVGTNNYVLAVQSYGDTLFVGGQFTAVEGVANTQFIAAWDGAQWVSVGDANASYTMGNVSSLEVYDGKLIAGGVFNFIGPVPVEIVNNIAAWNGSEWSDMGVSSMNDNPRCMTVYDEKLIVGGDFTSINGTTVNHIVSWDGAEWSSLGVGVGGSVRGLGSYDNQLYAGGYFTTAGTTDAIRIALWDGIEWSAVGDYRTGTGRPINVLLEYNNKLIVGGQFHVAGDLDEANNIVAWDGFNWSPLDEGVGGDVTEMILYDNKLIAAGDFIDASGTEVNKIASWDGSSWSALGSGIVGEIMSMIIYNNDLLVAGDIESAGSITVNNLAIWDGSSWSAMDAPVEENIYELTIYNDELYLIGGYPGYLTSDGWNIEFWEGINRFYQFTGSNWILLATDVEMSLGPNYEMLEYHDDLLLARVTYDVNGSLLAWGGTSFYSYYGPVQGYILDLCIFNDNLYISGDIDLIGIIDLSWTTVQNIAGFIGMNWYPLGEGTNSTSYAMCEFQNRLYVGGSFTTAGDKETVYLAAWNPFNICCIGGRGNINNLDGEPGIDVSDIVYFVDYMFNEGLAPVCEEEVDVNADSSNDISDLVYLIDYMFNDGSAPLGCP